MQEFLFYVTVKNKTMVQVLITLKLPEEIVKEMDKLKWKYFPEGAKKISSHITLFRPFYISEDRIEKLTKGLTKQINGLKPFEIKFDGISNFGQRVAFFNPSCPPELLTLHQKTAKFIKKVFRFPKTDRPWEGRKYRPHATIIAKSSISKIKKCLRELKNYKFRRRAQVKGIEIYVFEKEIWRLIQRVDF